MVKVPVTVFTALTCVAPPVKLSPVGADQVYTVPVGTMPLVTSVGVTLNSNPLQIVVLIGVTIALGFRLTVKENADPTQLPEVGVTI